MTVAYLTRRSNPVSLSDLSDADLVVSFGYRHILSPDITRAFEGRAFNIHISVLPWNRGASPNLWAWKDDTPHGVTLHMIDAGVDTGPIVAQREVEWADGETLASSYRRLTEIGTDMMRTWLPRLERGDWTATTQKGDGSFHTVAQSDALFYQLPLGWDTPCSWFKRTA